MVKVAMLTQFEARTGREREVQEFLRAALPFVKAEPETSAWFGLRLGPKSFGIFDVFPDEAGRMAHLSGCAAEQLIAKTPGIFAAPPIMQKFEIVAAKLPQFSWKEMGEELGIRF